MKSIILAAAAIGTMFVMSAPAEARDGCGAGAHRTPRGRCVPNRGAQFRGPPPRVGVFYPGRGYYSGGRYYRQRYRHHNGWRYR